MIRQIVLATALLLLPLSARAQDLQPHSCDELGQCCETWVVDLRKADGRVWGSETGDLAKVRASLEDARAFESRYCRFLGKPEPCSEHNYQNPGPPRCDAMPASEPDACFSDTARRIADLENRIRDRMRTTAAAGASAEVVAAAGSQIAGYGAALKDASVRLQDLRKTLEKHCTPALNPVQQLWGDVDSGGFRGHGERARAGFEIRRKLNAFETIVDGADIFEPPALTMTSPTPEILVGARVADRDRDGVTDADDGCPDEKGAASEGGCPAPDETSTPFVRTTPLIVETPRARVVVPTTCQAGLKHNDPTYDMQGDNLLSVCCCVDQTAFWGCVDMNQAPFGYGRFVPCCSKLGGRPSADIRSSELARRAPTATCN